MEEITQTTFILRKCRESQYQSEITRCSSMFWYFNLQKPKLSLLLTSWMLPNTLFFSQNSEPLSYDLTFLYIGPKTSTKNCPDTRRGLGRGPRSRVYQIREVWGHVLRIAGEAAGAWAADRAWGRRGLGCRLRARPRGPGLRISGEAAGAWAVFRRWGFSRSV